MSNARKAIVSYLLHSSAASLLIATSSAQAITIAVDTTADVVADDGACSLREAISAINSAVPSGTLAGECPAGDGNNDTIRLSAGTYALTIAATGLIEDLNANGDLDIRAPVIIEGAGKNVTVIDAAAINDRALDLPASGVNATVRGLSIINGRTQVFGTVTETGGGVRVNTSDTLTLVDVEVRNNAISTSASPSGGGGGIAVFGTLVLDRCDITDNVAGNFGLGGGGIYVGSGKVVGNRTRIDGNSASNSGNGGGGVAINTGASLYLSQSSATHNTAPFGAAIWSQGGSVNIADSTLSANTGDAIFANASTTVQLDFVTLHANAGNDLRNSGSSIAFRNSVVDTCLVQSGMPATYTSQGYNIAGTGCPSDGPGDLGAVDPKLGDLNANGAVTDSMLPHPDSPAINAASCGASNLYTDQRNHERPASVPHVPDLAEGCDIGAVELDDDIFWNGFEN